MPGHHAGSPHRMATKARYTAQPLRQMPGHCRYRMLARPHARVTQRPAPNPRTACSPNRFSKEAAGGMRCCGDVLGRGERQAQGAGRERCHTGPPLQDSTSHPEGNPTGKRQHAQKTNSEPQRGRARLAERSASDPRTACPRNRLNKEAASGMRCCGGVLKRSRRQAKCADANATTPDRRPRTAQAIRIAIQRANAATHKRPLRDTTWTREIRPAPRHKPPNRPHTKLRQPRSGRWHAVLRKRAETKQAASSRRTARTMHRQTAAPGRHKPSGEQSGGQTPPHTKDKCGTQPGHARIAERPASDPRTACPPNRFNNEAVGGMRCCGSVLKRAKRQAQGAERKGCNTD